MRRLMTHLAQFSAFSKQGEILCTRGLEYLLENPGAREAFKTHVLNPAGLRDSAPLSWRAEAPQQDGGRPDLEGRTVDGRPVVKIEAKLGAELTGPQLESYAADLQQRAGGGLLLVVVPRRRLKDATATAFETFPPHRTGCVVKAVSWDEILAALARVSDVSFTGDLEQFHAMYRALTGTDIEQFTSAAEVLAWRDREQSFINFVERATRQLTEPNKVLPMGSDDRAGPSGYRRRYVVRAPGAGQPAFSVGVQDPFRGHTTPVWLRFHHETAAFSVIRDHLTASPLSQRLVTSGGHLWLPLDVPLNADGDHVVESLVAQAKDVARVAYDSLP